MIALRSPKSYNSRGGTEAPEAKGQLGGDHSPASSQGLTLLHSPHHSAPNLSSDRTPPTLDRCITGHETLSLFLSLKLQRKHSMDHRDNLRDKQCQKSLVSESAVTCSTTGNQLSPTPASAGGHPRMVTLSFSRKQLRNTLPLRQAALQLSRTPCPSPALPLSQVFMQTLCPATYVHTSPKARY